MPTYLYQLSCNSTPSPAANWTPRNATALDGVISPLARGRSLVRAGRAVRWCFARKPILIQERTNGLVQSPVPQVVDRAARTAHNEGACPEYAQIREWHGVRELKRV